MKHDWTTRSGTYTRWDSDGRGGYHPVTVRTPVWRQCQRCGMSEGMVDLLGVGCDPQDTEEPTP